MDHGEVLAELVKAAWRAADGDSNDEEIEALQEALDYAVGMLRDLGVEINISDDEQED